MSKKLPQVGHELVVFSQTMDRVYYVQPPDLLPTDGSDALLRNFDTYGVYMRREFFLCEKGPNACQHGRACREIHVRTDRLGIPSNVIHRNLADTPCSRHPTGRTVNVFEHKSRTTTEVPSQNLLVTAGSQDYFQKVEAGEPAPRMQQCTHFQRKQCLRGMECGFLHILKYNPTHNQKAVHQSRDEATSRRCLNSQYEGDKVDADTMPIDPQGSIALESAFGSDVPKSLVTMVNDLLSDSISTTKIATPPASLPNLPMALRDADSPSSRHKSQSNNSSLSNIAQPQIIYMIQQPAPQPLYPPPALPMQMFMPPPMMIVPQPFPVVQGGPSQSPPMGPSQGRRGGRGGGTTAPMVYPLPPSHLSSSPPMMGPPGMGGGGAAYPTAQQHTSFLFSPTNLNVKS